MIPVEEYKKYLEEYHLTDEEVGLFRDGWYTVINSIIDQELGVQNEKKDDNQSNRI